MIDESKLKVMEEINKESSESAASALSKMLGKEVKLDFPTILLKGEDMISAMTDQGIVGISEVTGDINGNLLMLYENEKGLKLMDMFQFGEVKDSKEMSEEARGAFIEFINIIGGAYLSEMANRLKFKILPNPPKFIGALEEVYGDIIQDIKENDDKLLILNSVLNIECEKIDGNMVLLLDSSSMEKIIHALGES